MSDLDHTKSLVSYKTILEDFEQAYRGASRDERFKVIKEICSEIMNEAKATEAKITPEEELEKVCGVLACGPIGSSYIPIANHQLLHQPQISPQGRWRPTCLGG